MKMERCTWGLGFREFSAKEATSMAPIFPGLSISHWGEFSVLWSWLNTVVKFLEKRNAKLYVVEHTSRLSLNLMSTDLIAQSV